MSPHAPSGIGFQDCGIKPMSVSFLGSPRRPWVKSWWRSVFQFSGELKQPLLLLDRALYHAKHRRNLSLL